ncbi:MAG: hypothetical protein M0Q45_06165 [Bacteroidales bacterium]|nr:hypothetical protein [Bacteroidales bacterium]MCK9499074.1 hypothetical protein [Bacteroidales bacterium]
MGDNQNKEIDILTLIIKISKFIKKYIIVLVSFTILGIAGGLAHYFFSKEIYKTKFIASSPIVDSRIVYELLEPIKIHISNNSTDSVANKLEISLEHATEIRSVSFDTTVNNAIIINLEVYSKENIIVISDAILNFLNNLEYINKGIDCKKKDLTKYIAVLDNEISKLNDLQEAILKNAQSNSNLSISNTYTEMLMLYQKKREIEKELAGLSNFKIINKNIVFITSKSILKSVLIFGFLGGFLGLISASFLEIKKLLKTINK